MKKLIFLTTLFSTLVISASAQNTLTAGKMRLANKVAIITGAASGNGKAMALLFAEEGATVAVVDINGEGAAETVRKITAAGATAFAIQADVTKEEDITRMVEETLRRYDRIDILVNNAGVFDMLLPVGDVSDEIWAKVIDINLTAPMRAIRKVIPVFERQGGGVIVNTSSIAGYTGARGGGAAYVASKHGLVGLTKNVAFNYKEKNIRCNAVAPGRVITNLRDNSQKIIGAKDAYDQTIGDWKNIEEAVEAGYDTNLRRAEPREIAYVALFLASDEASFVSGSVFTADGSWTSY